MYVKRIPAAKMNGGNQQLELHVERFVVFYGTFLSETAIVFLVEN